MNTIAALAGQWRNPSDVTTILMIIGGDVVRKALAQTTGTLFTPVCFSFGWVAYAFTVIIDIIGDGRLLPQPDYPAKLINLNTGYFRDNKHWVVGRILRDNEAWISRRYPLGSFAIRISIYEAESTHKHSGTFPYSLIHLAGGSMMVLQLVVASIPVILYSDWIILLITGAGTLLALSWGLLPQWKIEKLPNRLNSKDTYGLTVGNGSKDIMVIKGMGRCLNLEELCTADSPRHGRPWEQSARLSRRRGTFGRDRVNSTQRNSREHLGVPDGFWITRVACYVQCLLWMAILVTVAAVKENTWYLIIVGSIGMFQNAVLAGMDRNPRRRNLPLQLTDVIRTRKVMDGLMDLETAHEGCGRHLVAEFFPGELRDMETDWWKGNTTAYDEERRRYRGRRGQFRRTMATGNVSPQPSPVPAAILPRLPEARSKMQMTFTEPALDSVPQQKRSKAQVSRQLPSITQVISSPAQQGEKGDLKS